MPKVEDFDGEGKPVVDEKLTAPTVQDDKPKYVLGETWICQCCGNVQVNKNIPDLCAHCGTILQDDFRLMTVEDVKYGQIEPVMVPVEFRKSEMDARKTVAEVPIHKEPEPEPTEGEIDLETGKPVEEQPEETVEAPSEETTTMTEEIKPDAQKPEIVDDEDDEDK